MTKLDEISAGILRFPVVTICNLNEFRFNNITKNDMYQAGQFLGFLDDQRKLHPATIPQVLELIISKFCQYHENKRYLN